MVLSATANCSSPLCDEWSQLTPTPCDVSIFIWPTGCSRSVEFHMSMLMMLSEQRVLIRFCQQGVQPVVIVRGQKYRTRGRSKAAFS